MKKKKKVDGPDAHKLEFIKLEFFIDPDNPNSGSKVSRYFTIFKDGWKFQRSGTSSYILMFFREIENLMPLVESIEKSRMYWILLKGQALSYFEHHIRRRSEAEGSELSDNDFIELVIIEL
jgi:hypothetical protein